MSSPLQLLRLMLPQGASRLWFKRNEASLPDLSPPNRRFIEDITGHTPLLIRPLLTMKIFDETTILESGELKNMRDNIFCFYIKLLESVRSRDT
jgi:hypothetical protein